MKSIVTPMAASALMILGATHAHAANVAIWQDSYNVSYFDSAITAAGQTPVTISALTTSGLGGVSILILLNSSNSGYSNEMTSGAGDLANFVSNGGTLVFFDRTAGNDNAVLDAVLPGSFSFNLVSNYGADIDIVSPGHPYFAGLNDLSLDGGNSSSHGYILSGDLPGGAVSHLHEGGYPSRIVDFSYTYGSGIVHYSTIPADYYASGYGSASIAAGLNVYVTNLAGEAVPEPGSAMLSAVVVLSLLTRRRRN